MGSKNWLLFKSPKEARLAKAYLAPLEGEIGVDGKYGCSLTFTSAKLLEVGISAGAKWSEINDFVQREVCRRFDVRKIGADSVGWYPDSDFLSEHPMGAGARYPGYTSWAAWAKDYKPEWGHYLPKKRYWPAELHEEFDVAYKVELDAIKEVEAFVVAKFEELDRCAE